MADRYWVGGTSTWDATALLKWALTSGGIGGQAVPTAADDVYIDSGSGAVTVTLNAASVCKSLSFTSGSGAFTGTFAGAQTLAISGNLTLVSGMTWSNTSQITFNSTTAQTITSAGKTLNNLFTFNGVAGSWQLQDALTTTSTLGVVLTNGSLDLNNKNLTCVGFGSNNANTRSLIFGTGSIYLTGNAGTIFTTANSTGLTTTGTKNIYCSYSGATGTRTLTSTGAETVVPNFFITAGTDIVTTTAGGGAAFGTLDYTGFAGTGNSSSASNSNIFGNVVVSSGMTFNTTSQFTYSATTARTITSNGKTFLMNTIFNGVGGSWQLQDNLTLQSTNFITFTNGTIDLGTNRTLTCGTFASTNSNTRSIFFNSSGAITLIGSGTVWNTGTPTNFSYTGTSKINVSNNTATATTVSTGAMTAAQALNFNYTVGTYTLTDSASVYNSLNFTGFTGTIPNSVRTIYGNLTLVSGMTLTAGANATTFAATSGTNTITTAAKTLDFPLTFNGVGGTFAFQDALTQGSTRAFTITNGTVQLRASATSTVGSFATSGTNQKTLQSTTSGTQATLSQASGTVSTSYLTIQDIFATGGATWNAFYYNGNLDNGNNTNWIFGESPAYGAEYEYKLRSFTEPRRF